MLLLAGGADAEKGLAVDEEVPQLVQRQTAPCEAKMLKRRRNPGRLSLLVF